MGSQGEEFVGLSLAESGSDRRDAEKNVFEMKEACGSAEEGKKRDRSGLALLTMLMTFSVQREGSC